MMVKKKTNMMKETRLARFQKKLAVRVRKNERKGQPVSASSYRRMYGEVVRVNDGIMLHTPNLFTNSDDRSHSVQTGGRILSTPDYFLRTGGKKKDSKRYNDFI